MGKFPYRVVIFDWDGKSSIYGGNGNHWRDEPLVVVFNDTSGYERLRKVDGLGFLEAFLDGAVDLRGNLYLLTHLKNVTYGGLRPLRALVSFLSNSLRQTNARASKNVRSHYDAPDFAIRAYLDGRYQSYTCAVFEDPNCRTTDELLKKGNGRDDPFDSLEKAQWRKFAQALDLLEPLPGSSLLDIGTGYGGLLEEALGATQLKLAVGWTHSRNQAHAARERLAGFDAAPWEVHLGDYRQEERVFDNIASIGMVSHVGPRGLSSYARAVRRRIRTGGRYLHHDLMIEQEWLPQSLQLGPAFNKKYVWPGFHWYTLGEHIRALERSGFRVIAVDDLSAHYAKTTAAWYERMCESKATVVRGLGEPGFRAWQIFLAGITSSLDLGGCRDYRVLCVAT